MRSLRKITLTLLVAAAVYAPALCLRIVGFPVLLILLIQVGLGFVIYHVLKRLKII